MLRNASKFLHNMWGSESSHESTESEAPVIPRIYNEKYFYGRITRSEGEAILTKAGNDEGLYLLRESITPMGNFSLSMAHDGIHVHYSIEKQIDGKYMIPEGQKFKDPIELVEFYKAKRIGLVTYPRIPCNRHPSQEAIAYRGLSYQDLHTHMRDAARKINADPSKAMGSMHDYMMMYVLRNIHEKLPWFHGQIDREEAAKRLKQSSMDDGVFIVRSRPELTSFALTMCQDRQYRHYIITCTDGENYHIENGPRFKALVILIDHYHNRRDGLLCNLTSPCCNPDYRHQAWERYKHLSVNITNATPVVVRSLPSPISPTALRPPPPPPPTSDEEREQVLLENDQEACSEEAQHLESIYFDIRTAIMSMKLKPKDIQLEGRLGSGQFGEVMKGKCRVGDKVIPVAVKTLKNHEGQEEIESEARLMKRLDHPNIVRMIGVCTVDTLMLVMELAELGPLKKYLTSNHSMPHWHRLELMIQICQGMAYLESKAVVHRDLAARNILLMTARFAKISDFGMSRMMDNDSQYYTSNTPGKWPLIWYAPECLNFHKFDSKSDVWSFGVTMWEIMTNGKRPYTRMEPRQILQYLEQGNRLTKPESCDNDVYTVMNHCWAIRKENRPNFTELLDELKPLHDKFSAGNI